MAQVPRHVYPAPVANALLMAAIGSTVLLAALPGGNLINLAIAGAFVGAVAFAIIAGKRAIWFSPELGLLLIWMAFAAIGCFYAIDEETAFFKLLTMLQVAVLVFCTQQVIYWQRASNGPLLAYALALAMSYLLTFSGMSAQEMAGSEDVAGDVARVASTLNDENTFGAVALMSVSLVLIAIAQGLRTLWLLPVGFLLILVVVAVVNSGSRTALMGGAFLLIASVWAFRLWRGKTLSKLLATGMLILIATGGVYIVFQDNEEVQARVEAVISEDSALVTRVTGFFEFLITGDTRAERGNSIDERMSMIEDALQITADNPFIGVGLDNFRFASGAGTYAHSNLMELSTGSGIVGFVLFHLIYAVLTLRIMKLAFSRQEKTVGRLALTGLMAYFLMDITRVSYYEKTSWIYLAILTAVVQVAQDRIKEARAKVEPNGKSKRRRRRKNFKTNRQNDDMGDLEELPSMLDLNS